VKRVVLWLLILALTGVLVFTGWVYVAVTRPYKGYSGSEQFVEIPRGSGPRTMGARLADAGVVRSVNAFQSAVYLSAAGGRLQAGEYRFDRSMSAQEVVDKIVRGDVYVEKITFREGLTIKEMAALFQERGFGPAASFITAASDASRIRHIDPAARDLEGYLFPDTYAVPRRITAAARGLDVRQLVTLASIVEKETGKDDERTLVSAVYSNRLKIGMGLQADPTVIYALDRAGRYNGNLTRENMQYDSPYNTYRYAGLPPGPIASPGRASLEAAARPANAPYLYFVSRNDGSHAFAATLDEHNRNVFEYQSRRGRR